MSDEHRDSRPDALGASAIRTSAATIIPAPTLHALLTRAAQRVGALAALRGAAVGIAVAAVWNLRGFVTNASTQPTTVSLLVPLVFSAAIGACVGWWKSGAQRRQIAATLEARVPAAANLLVTSDELSRAPQRPTSVRAATTPAVAGMVVQRAERMAQSINLPSLFPARPSLVRAASALGAWLLVTILVSRVEGGPSTAPLRAVIAAVTGRTEIQRVRVRITPPGYAKQQESSLSNPSRIDALAGSRITLTIDASADTIVAIIARGSDSESRTILPGADGNFSLTVPGDRDGYVALEPRRVANTGNNSGSSASSNTGPRRLIGLTIRSDEAPRVRIVAPARDLIVPDGKRTLDVRVEADDDLALGSLALRYTKVSGSGERFTFSEGEVPVSVARGTPAQWTARAALALEPLLQEPGDLVVYRAVATDSRPGSPAIESDAFIAELAAPGGVAALGFSLDPDEDRYALSQQMVILKTEKLIAKRATLPAAALAEEAAQLAGEQRRVRAEFVFMMGGEFAQEVTGEDASGDLDESHEAESEGELADGRMANKGRTSLLSAVRAMSRAAVALTVADLTPALASEKAALKQLQDAFARQRFLMRALSQREQLDPTRRLTGKLDSIARTRAPLVAGERDTRIAEWRRVLTDVQRASAETSDGASLVLLAERVLQLDPSSVVAQRIAAQLDAAGAVRTNATNNATTNATTSATTNATTDASPGKARVTPSAAPNAALRTRQAQLDSATISLTNLVRAALRPAAVTLPTTQARQLQIELEAAFKSTPGSTSDRGVRSPATGIDRGGRP